ncbi:MAG: hypothetical protein Q9166_007314 [cf. Caloplaca sp. 2 TL-2023]
MKSEYHEHESLYPEIISTCRTISDETAPILYTDNTFCFWTDYINLEFDHLPRNIKRACKDLMSYDIDDWDDVPVPLEQSTFAAFLRKIGPINASSIRALELSCFNPWQAADDVVLATQLCTNHMQGLRTFELYVAEKEGIHYEESPDYWHPNWSSPFWCNGPFKPMYRALQRFVDKIQSLKTFKYHTERAQFRFQDDEAMSKIRQLEEFVKARAEQQSLDKD